jgi:integrase
VIELLYECGIRRFELCGIEIKHLNIPKREIYIWRGKGGNPKGKNDKERRARYVFIKEERILTDLKAYLGSRTTGRLIQSTNKSKDGIDYSGINRIIAHVAKLAGMKCPNPNRKNIHPHMLRHSFGRREDLDLASKQKIMGHSDFKITMNFYGKVTTQEAKKRFMSTQSPLQDHSIKYCKDCEKQLLADAKFCSECGKQQENKQ